MELEVVSEEAERRLQRLRYSIPASHHQSWDSSHHPIQALRTVYARCTPQDSAEYVELEEAKVLLEEGSKQQLPARSTQGEFLPHLAERGSIPHSTPELRSWDEQNRKRRLQLAQEEVEDSGWR
jgi:hypothetical protein